MKNKITEIVNTGNDNQVRNVKQNLNLKITITFHSKIQILTKRQRISES